MSSNTQKLRVLRARTDHDLLVLVQRELDNGMALANVAATRNSPAFSQAVRAANTAAGLLSRIAGLNEDERLRIEARLRGLQLLLNGVPAFAAARPYPASFAS